MALTERTQIGKLDILEDGQLQVREDRIIVADGIEIARLYHRRVVEPTATPAPDAKLVQDIAAVVWTPDIIQAYQAKKRAAQSPPSLDTIEIGR